MAFPGEIILIRPCFFYSLVRFSDDSIILRMIVRWHPENEKSCTFHRLSHHSSLCDIMTTCRDVVIWWRHTICHDDFTWKFPSYKSLEITFFGLGTTEIVLEDVIKVNPHTSFQVRKLNSLAMSALTYRKTLKDSFDSITWTAGVGGNNCWLFRF